MILIVTEGEKTEPNYFEGLRMKWSLSTAEVEVEGEGATPRKVVEKAISLKEQRERESKSPFKTAYDEVWCVVDRDTHADFHDARQLATGNDVTFAVSVPCFEFWYLLHFTYTTRQFANFAELKPELGKHLRGYDKATDYLDDLLPRLDDAFKNAAQLRRDNEKTGNSSPATDVDLLVKVLEGISKR